MQNATIRISGLLLMTWSLATGCGWEGKPIPVDISGEITVHLDEDGGDTVTDESGSGDPTLTPADPYAGPVADDTATNSDTTLPVDGSNGTADEAVPLDPTQNADYCEPGPEMATLDTDSDGVANVTDNCPYTANTDQIDKNKDGVGAACALQKVTAKCPAGNRLYAWEITTTDANNNGIYDSCEFPQLVSVDQNGQPYEGKPSAADLSGDGQYVAFNVFFKYETVKGNPGYSSKIFVRDRATGKITEVKTEQNFTANNVVANGQPSPSPVGYWMTPDGRHLMVDGTPPGYNANMYVHDLHLGKTELISQDLDGQPIGNTATTFYGSGGISADGRYAAFHYRMPYDAMLPKVASAAGMYVRDRQQQQTTLVSVSSAGEVAFNPSPGQGAGAPHSYKSQISAPGRYVIFSSGAKNLVPGGTAVDFQEAFVHDQLTKKTAQFSINSQGSGGIPLCPGSGDRCTWASDISADGCTMIFTSMKAGLVPNDTNGAYDVFVRDRHAGVTTRVSVSSTGAEGNAPSLASSGAYYVGRRFSGDGRYVVFHSVASNLTDGDANGDKSDVFVRDRLLAKTERVSYPADSKSGTAGVATPRISTDGRYILFNEKDKDAPLQGENLGMSKVYLALNPLWQPPAP